MMLWVLYDETSHKFELSPERLDILTLAYYDFNYSHEITFMQLKYSLRIVLTETVSNLL